MSYKGVNPKVVKLADDKRETIIRNHRQSDDRLSL